MILLGVALYALLSLARPFTAPQAAAYDRNTWQVLFPVIGLFAGVCTLASLVFLGVGLRWLGTVSRTAE